MRRATLGALLASTLVLAACTTMRTVPAPSHPEAPRAQRLEPGDTVDVTLRSGEVKQFKLTAVDAEALQGPDIRIAYADIQEVQVRRFSLGRSAGALGGLVLAFEILASVLILTYWL